MALTVCTARVSGTPGAVQSLCSPPARHVTSRDELVGCHPRAGGFLAGLSLLVLVPDGLLAARARMWLAM